MLRASSLQSLRRLFQTGFAAQDVAESLLSCDGTDQAEEIRRFMEERRLEVLGVRKQGSIAGYVEKQLLGDGTCSDSMRPFLADEVILNTTPIADVVCGLKVKSRLFVMVFGSVGGIVTKSDLQKPAVRMWLFGMVTLIEMRMTQMIESAEPDDAWTAYVSEQRLAKARTLLEERKRRNQDLDLLGCLQFSDKFQIVAKNEGLRSLTRFASRRKVEEAGKKLERLRNNLAHAQDIISTDWEAVVDLSENMDALLASPNMHT